MEYNYFLNVITTTTNCSTKLNKEDIEGFENSLRVEHNSGPGCLVSGLKCLWHFTVSHIDSFDWLRAKIMAIFSGELCRKIKKNNAWKYILSIHEDKSLFEHAEVRKLLNFCD